MDKSCSSGWNAIVCLATVKHNTCTLYSSKVVEVTPLALCFCLYISTLDLLMCPILFHFSKWQFHMPISELSTFYSLIALFIFPDLQLVSFSFFTVLLNSIIVHFLSLIQICTISFFKLGLLLLSWRKELLKYQSCSMFSLFCLYLWIYASLFMSYRVHTLTGM